MKKVRRLSSVLLIVCLLLSFTTHVQASGIPSNAASSLVYSYFDEWNEDMVDYNCYAYAINLSDWCCPGDFGGGVYDGSADIDEMADLVAGDLSALDYDCIVQHTDLPTSLGDWSNVIAMRKDTTYGWVELLPGEYIYIENDFHFAKMKSDGWYHKPSDTAVLKFKSSPDNGTMWTNECVDEEGYHLATISYDSPIIYMSYRRDHGKSVPGLWTGNESHSGRTHEYEFYTTCADCGESKGKEWISYPCIGPTCIYPWSVEPEHEVS